MAVAMSRRVVAKVSPRMAAREAVSKVGVPEPEKWGRTSRPVGPPTASGEHEVVGVDASWAARSTSASQNPSRNQRRASPPLWLSVMARKRPGTTCR